MSFCRFLEAKGYPELALEIATENDYKFELAVQLERYVAYMTCPTAHASKRPTVRKTNVQLDFAFDIPRLEDATEIAKNSGSENKWKQLGELAMSSGKLLVSEDCLRRAGTVVNFRLVSYPMTSNRGFGSRACDAPF